MRIIDCYLAEGQKVFYRVSLALVKTFAKAAKTWRAEAKAKGIEAAFKKFAREMPVIYK